MPPKSRAQLDWDAEISFVFDEAFTRELRLAATSRTTAIGVFAALCGVLAALFAFVLFRSRWGESRLTRSTRDVRVYGRVAVSGLGLFLGGVFASLTADVKLQFGAIEVFHVPLTTTLTPVFVAYGVVYGALALLRKTAWTKRITYHLISFVVALPILWFWFSRHEYQAAVTDPGYQLLGMAVVCGLVLLAQFVHRFGLGNGYAVVLAGALRSELNFQNVSLYAFLSVIALLVLVALLLSERAHRRLRHPWLVGAGIPLIATASWSALLLSLSHYGLVADMAIEVVPDLFVYPAHALGGILIFVSPSLLWFIVRFVQAGREERGIRVVGRWKVSARVERMASLVIPAALIVCLSFHYEFGSKPNLDLLLVGLVPSVLLVAIAMDLFHEFVAWRRHSSRVKIAALHRVRETEELRRALEGYDIDALLRGRCLRQLLAFLGPWVPVEVMVPKAQAALAREIVQSTLGPERSKESLLAA